MTTTAPAVNLTRLRQIGMAAALATGAVLLLKAVLIIATGNAISETAMGILYVTGVALPLVAAAGIAAAYHGRARQAAVYLGTLVAHLLYLMVLSDAVGAAVEPFTDQAHIVDEVPVALLGVAWLAVGLWMRAADRR